MNAQKANKQKSILKKVCSKWIFVFCNVHGDIYVVR